VEAAPADHGEDAAVTRIDGDERCGRAVLFGQPLLDRLLGESLDLEVDRGVDLQPCAKDGSGPVVGEQLLLHVLGEVGLAALPGGQLNVLRLGEPHVVCLDGILPGD
jgi:hypothetical protein